MSLSRVLGLTFFGIAAAALWQCGSPHTTPGETEQTAEPTPNEAPIVMSPKDYVLDAKELRDRLVTITGAVYCFNDLCSITEPNQPNINISMDAGELPRNARAQLLNCSQPGDPCMASVTGRANFIGQLEATTIEFHTAAVRMKRQR